MSGPAQEGVGGGGEKEGMDKWINCGMKNLPILRDFLSYWGSCAIRGNKNVLYDASKQSLQPLLQPRLKEITILLERFARQGDRKHRDIVAEKEISQI